MEKNTVLLQDTEAFMHGELDNVTVQQNCVVLDLVQGGYVPYGCYTSAPIPMPLFDALRVSWNAASPEDTAVEAQVRVMVDGNWTTWNSFGKWSPSLHREGPPYQARGPVQRWPDRLQLDSKYATAVQLRIYLYSKNEKATPTWVRVVSRVQGANFGAIYGSSHALGARKIELPLIACITEVSRLVLFQCNPFFP